MLNPVISDSFSNCILISQGVNNLKELGILPMLPELFTTVVPQTQCLKRNSILFRSLSLNYFPKKKKKINRKPTKMLDYLCKFISLEVPLKPKERL